MVAVGSLHNTRMLRFFLVLIVVILTIFIYASYSTTATLTQNHVHSAASPPQQLIGPNPMLVINNTDTKDYGQSVGVESAPRVSSRQPPAQQQLPLEVHRKHPQHRLPTIDEDALLDGGSAGASPQIGGAAEQTPNADELLLEEQQYGQSVDGITGE